MKTSNEQAMQELYNDMNIRLQAATQMVSDLCKSRGEAGSREWVMSIPARPDDPDLVIAAALDDAAFLLGLFVPWATTIQLLDSQLRTHTAAEAHNAPEAGRGDNSDT